MKSTSGRDIVHFLQYTDFFTYNLCRAILMDSKQLYYRSTDANFFWRFCNFRLFILMYDANGYQIQADG